MNIAIWGYGHFGIKCGELIRDRLIHDRLICYVDINRSKLRDDNNNTVVSPAVLATMVKCHLIDKIIVPGYEPDVFRQIMKKLYSLDVDFFDLLFYAEYSWLYKRIVNDNLSEFSELIIESKKTVPLVGAMEIEVIERCNLNCKRCNHYSNICNDDNEVSLDVFQRDIGNLAKLINNIKRLKLTGGEPLLNKKLHKFLKICRDCFPDAYIAIVTNGLLIKEQNEYLWEACIENDVVIEISVYPPLKDKIGSIQDFLKCRGVKNKIFREGDEFGAYLNIHGDSDPIYAMMQCYAQVCHVVKDGRIFKCASVVNVNRLNKEYEAGLPESYLNIDELMVERNPGEKLRQYLVEPIEMCKYCNKFKFFPWERTVNDARLDDWVSLS